jgi:SAM-dependent methyltransferase
MPSAPSAVPQPFDRTLLRRRLDRAAGQVAAADFLHSRAADDIAERLSLILRDFPLAVDLGARGGAVRKALSTSEARVGAIIEAELSGKLLAGRPGLRVQADEERPPFADGSLDLVVSSLALHAVNDFVGALIAIRRSLKPDGLFIGALLGGDTLTELRGALLQAESELRGGAGPRVAPFLNALDAPGLLQRAGFALPVSDVDRVRVGYPHPLALMLDLRRMGETAVMTERSRRPLTRPLLARLFESYPRRPDGRIEATFEIVTLTGWAAKTAS